jgi:hypothetical protein
VAESNNWVDIPTFIPVLFDLSVHRISELLGRRNYFGGLRFIMSRLPLRVSFNAMRPVEKLGRRHLVFEYIHLLPLSKIRHPVVVIGRNHLAAAVVIG